MKSLAKQLPENITAMNVSKCKHRFLHLSNHRFKATLIDGVQRASSIQEQIRKEVVSMQHKGYQVPHLTTILVGNNPASQVYTKRKIASAKTVGITTNTLYFESSVEERELISLISSLNIDKRINAILVQLPLPSHICERRISDVIAPEKDVDGFSFSNLGRFVLNMDALWPCTALAVRDLIQSTGIETKGKHAVVCGRSKNVGFPIAVILQSSGIGDCSGLDMTTTICHQFTPYDKLSALTRTADVVVSATGVPGLIGSSMVKPGACVIDVGITRVLDKNSSKARLIGDVKFDEVREVARFLTPVPGGVGPMTVAMLLKNTLKAAKYQMLPAL